jgi:hypothetical protein
MGASVGVFFHPWMAPALDLYKNEFERGFHLSPMGDPSGTQK